MKSNQ